MDTNTIKKIIDSCIGKGTDEIVIVLKSLLDELSEYVLQNYKHSREVMQFTIGQLTRIHMEATCLLMSNVLNRVNSLSDGFENYRADYDDYVKVDWQEDDVRQILHKMAPFMKGKISMASPGIEMANSLTEENRREMASYIADSIQHYGVNMQWNECTLGNHLMYLWMLYSICKVDGQLKWVFHYANNFIDRLATSQYPQQARDVAENMIVIGYHERMEAEGYFCATRAYTITNQPLAGLLFMDIALRRWLEHGGMIPYKIAFEILWQLLKLARGIRFCSEEHFRPICKVFESLNPTSYDVMSFYHTYFSLMLLAKKEKVLDGIADFLDSHREWYFKNLKHGAIPWITLTEMARDIFPKANFLRLQPYIDAPRCIVEHEGNGLYLDYYEQKNEETRLKELIVKLGATRNVKDFSHDNHMAMLLAGQVMDKAYKEKKPSNFILAMHVKADFTFVMSAKGVEGLYGRMTFCDVDGREYYLPIEDLHFLDEVMQHGDRDEVLWVGKGSHGLYGMSLLDKTYTFEKLDSFGNVNIEQLQQELISRLRYERYLKKPGQSIYSKDDAEMEHEAKELKDKLSLCSISVVKGAERLLVAKDMSIAAYPHQLLVDARENKFVGSMLPSCNIISTEVLIKTNFEQPLRKDFSCAYWSPVNSNEITFAMIKSQLDYTLRKYHFTCKYDTNPMHPICSEINIACAHGGMDISNTSWFYADDTPIVETDKIIGRGKLLILFVCHSGTITRPDYDNAMHTIIKRYIRVGYSSVIAPMWALNTEILPIWLEAFMTEIENGEYVIDALFRANMVVKQQYIAPEVYACLHLFGNPYLQIAERPVLSIVENNTDNENNEIDISSM